MVTIVSAYQDGFTGSNLKIDGGPLYREVFKIIDFARISVVTNQCSKDVAQLEKDESSLKESIRRAVSTGRFLGSEWCKISQNDVWAACDAYSFSEKAWIEAAHKEMECDFYVKFCVGKTGSLIITISFHTHRQRH